MIVRSPASVSRSVTEREVVLCGIRTIKRVSTPPSDSMDISFVPFESLPTLDRSTESTPSLESARAAAAPRRSGEYEYDSPSALSPAAARS